MDNLMIGFEIMVKGMVGIFVVNSILMVGVWGMNKMNKSSKS